MLPVGWFPGLLELPLGGSVYELLAEHCDTRAAQLGLDVKTIRNKLKSYKIED